MDVWCDLCFFFFSSRRRHTRCSRDWSSDVCSSDLSGGDVWLVANRDVASLLAFRDHPHRRAEKGGHGQGKGRHGARGADAVVKVPEGTVVRSKGGEALADLVAAGDRWLAARGRRGGQGKAP